MPGDLKQSSIAAYIAKLLQDVEKLGKEVEDLKAKTSPIGRTTSQLRAGNVALSIVREFLVSSVSADKLYCVPHTHSESLSETAAKTVWAEVWKPYHLRRTPFDGNTVNSITYAYLSDTTRTARFWDKRMHFERVLPDYEPSSCVVLAAYLGDEEWIDLNTDGRKFTRYEPQLWKATGTQSATQVTVAAIDSTGTVTGTPFSVPVVGSVSTISSGDFVVCGLGTDGELYACKPAGGGGDSGVPHWQPAPD